MSGLKIVLQRLVRLLSAWAWADEIETTRRAGGVLRWKSEYDWWHWYVVEVGTKGGHSVGSHADPMVRKAWDAARERMPNKKVSGGTPSGELTGYANKGVNQ